ncbi:alpha/beta fold hydrolase [Rhodococcus sp. NPDC056960]|uniref:alpha/beta fold hydrolase n=1 Tax=Rhodococcus sp. NPDC056960 TaxID=3345982 RepID=UPI0036272623
MPCISTPDGVRLCYDTFGDPKAAPLLLIQGLGAHMLGWHPELCTSIADGGFHVVRFDNRDVGLSQKFPAGGYRLADMAADTAGLLNALGIESAHVVGQSMGGLIAQELVIRDPARVRSLALVFTAPNLDFAVGTDLVHGRMALPRARSRGEAIELYLQNEAPCSSPGYPTDLEWQRELGGLMYDRDHDPDGAARQLAAVFASPDRTEALSQIAIPTTILHGDSDRLIEPAAGKALNRVVPGSTLTIFPGMGHELPRALWSDIVALIHENSRRAKPVARHA